MAKPIVDGKMIACLIIMVLIFGVVFYFDRPEQPVLPTEPPVTAN